MEKVEFSVDKIRFVHDGRARQRGAYSVQNKGGASLKVRVALTKGSDQVCVCSVLWNVPYLVYILPSPSPISGPR